MKSWYLLYFLILWSACNESIPEECQSSGVFTELNPDSTGIHHQFGLLSHSNVEGGGVAIADINNDGLQDIFLSGDSLHGLYRNEGGLKFSNVFSESGIPHFRGLTSVVFWDLDGDGLKDLIIGKRSTSTNFLYPKVNQGNISFNDTSSNLRVFINLGNFKFKESNSISIQTNETVSGIALADFDKNGLLDIAFCSWDVALFNGALKNLRSDTMKSDPVAKVFMQTKLNVFSESSLSLGITGGNRAILTSNSLIATDLNNDGWTDLVVTNDFETPDFYFFNQGGKKFRNIETEVTSYYSMGVDAADVNNDGLVDVFTTDMRPHKYYNQKTQGYEKSYEKEELLVKKKGLKSQQNVRNTLQINQGFNQFSEVGEAIGADATEWSWSVLMADFDNNQHKDIFIGNGFYHQNMMQLDAPLIADSLMTLNGSDAVIKSLIADTISEPYFHNYMFSNQGNMKFDDMSCQWLGRYPHSTRGAAYGDLDNDGDLELVFNNAKQQSVILRNNTVETTTSKFIRLNILNAGLQALHSTCQIYYDKNTQYIEMNPCRGFYSSSEQIFHFGLGNHTGKVDSIVITWANGEFSVIKDITTPRLLQINYRTIPRKPRVETVVDKLIFTESKPTNFSYRHTENDYTDFEQNLLLPKMYSRQGPFSAVGDLDGNGLQDMIIGGPTGQPSTIIYQTSSGEFTTDTIFAWNDRDYEDAGVAIFDINQDGRNDIFIASGGNEHPKESRLYSHRYYLNQGNGKYDRFDTGIRSSASIVKVGTLDSKVVVFIGGRIVPWNYPETPPSFLLTFQNGKFLDVTESLAPELKAIGMVTSAVWSDFTGDGRMDLVLAGEYMSPKFFTNHNGRLKNVSDNIIGLQNMTGLWTSVVEGDFNSDGKQDFIFGNLGDNTRYKAQKDWPLELFANDFDRNGSVDVITASYEQGNLYPTKQLSTLRSRIGGLAKKYFRYSSFAKATVWDIFDEGLLRNGFHAIAQTTQSYYFENQGNNEFQYKPLSFWAQVSPIMGMKVLDFDNDGFTDVMIVGNDFSFEVERGKYSAQKGLILKGDGNGGFIEILSRESGFNAFGDCRFLETLEVPGTRGVFVVGRNNSKALLFEYFKSGKKGV